MAGLSYEVLERGIAFAKIFILVAVAVLIAAAVTFGFVLESTNKLESDALLKSAILFSILGIASFGGAKMIGGETAREAATKKLTMTLVSVAILEGGGLLWSVFCYLVQDPMFVVGTMIHSVLLLLLWPGDVQVREMELDLDEEGAER